MPATRSLFPRDASAQPVRWIAMMAGLYFLAALGSLWVSAHPHKIATLWFANPIGTVALLALPWRRWLPMLAALMLTNLSVTLLAQGWGEEVWFTPGTFALGSCAEMLLAASLLRRLHISPDTLRLPGRLGQVLAQGALLPSLLSSFGAAALLTLGHQHHLPTTWLIWFAGGLIGSVATLPLALAFWLEGGTTLRQATGQTRTLGLLLFSVAITPLAVSTMPQPFIVVAFPLVLLAGHARFAVTALATLLTAVLLGLLQSTGVLVPPATTQWWGDGLFYASFLASLLPGLFLSASVEGRLQVMDALMASEQRFRALYTKTPAMLHSIDPQGRLIHVSALWLQTLGYEEPEVLGRPSADFMTPASARYSRDVVIPQAMRDGHIDNVEYQMVTRDGRVLDVLLSAVWTYDQNGKPLHSLAALQDVTEKKHLAAVSHFAEHDPLTGLPNRVLLQDRLERNCAHHARHGSRFAIGFLDLDHFKNINDSYGHDAGDELLKEVARRMQSALRASDTVCRVGGDEFVLLFSDVSQTDDLLALARKTLHSVAQPCRLGEDPQAPVVEVSASMGVAVFPEHGSDPQSLLAHADEAMYAAKHSGRNRCELYSPKLD